MDELEQARLTINDVDAKIVKLLEKRFQAVTKVNHYKVTHNLPILDSNREQKVLEKIANLTDDQSKVRYFQNIFQEIMDQSKDYQAAQRKEV